MSGIFNKEFNGYEKINETFYSNPFQSNNFGLLENKLKEKDLHNSPYKFPNNKINNQFTGKSNFNFLRTNENTEEQESKNSYSINDYVKFSCETFSSSKKIQIIKPENKENEILFSGFFGKKTEGNKINEHFKFEENIKQINPFENYFNECENKNTFKEFKTNSDFYSSFKHVEIPENIFNGKLFSLKKEEDNNINSNNKFNNENSKKDFNKLVKSVTISSFNDNTNNNNNFNIKSLNMNLISNSNTNNNPNTNLTKKKSKNIS